MLTSAGERRRALLVRLPDLPDAFMHSRPTVAGTRMLIDEFILSSRSRAELASPSAIGCHDAVARGAGGAAGRMAYRAPSAAVLGV